MFKNLSIYRIFPEWNADLTQALSEAAKQVFVECGKTQAKSVGWTPPRQEQGALIESVGGQWIMKMMIETKSVPGSMVRKTADERAKEIEEQTGRRPKGKALKQLKEEITHELMPQAFPKQETITVWVDPKKRLVAVDAGSVKKGDEVGTLMAETFSGFGVQLVQTNLSAATSMSGWLREREAPAGFSIDRDCHLKSTDEGKSAITYAKHGLDNEEVRHHLEQGKVATKLAMTWDDKVSFMLTDTMQLKKLNFENVKFEKAKEGEDGFDANAAIATGELAKMIPDLLDALGGEMVAAGAEA